MGFNIPNTTPVPNEIINGWAKKLNGSELKVLLVVTRVTLGWILDKQTGLRKLEDWLNYTQLTEKTGLSTASLTSAIDSLVNKYKLVEIRDEQGNVLNTKQERKRVGERKGKLLYRLNLNTLEETSSYFDHFKNQSDTTLKSKEVTTLKIKDNKSNIINHNITNIYATLEYLEKIPDEDIEKYKETFSLSESIITEEGIKAADWCRAKGRRQKDYRAFLRNWLRNYKKFNGDTGKRFESENLSKYKGLR